MGDMTNILINDIIPILVIMILGYLCGKFSYFSNEQRQGFNKLVLNVALPAALFVSIVKATREMLVSDITLTLISLIGTVGMFMLSFALCKLIFKHNTQEAAVCALIAGSPTIGFLGFAVLDPIYGASTETNLVIAIVAIIVNAITIPIGFYLINVGMNKDAKLATANVASGAAGTATTTTATDGSKVTTDEKGHKHHLNADGTENKALDHAEARVEKAEAHLAAVQAKQAKQAEIEAEKAKDPHYKKPKNPNVTAIVNALKEPVVWSPLVAVLLVILGVHVPSQLDPCFELIAKANSGVAVLAAGMALATVKFSLGAETIWNTFFRLILTPAVILAAGLIFGMGADVDKLAMLVMAVALPPAFSGIIISARYNIYVREGASSVAVSTVGFAATAILWVWLVPVIAAMFH